MITLGPGARGLRLDRALADALAGPLPEASRTTVAAWIAEGRVLVDGRALPGKTRVRGGERVEIRLPPPRPTTLEPEPLELAVLHEDDAILVLDKPAGLTVHPGGGRRGGTLANALVHRLRGLPERLGSDRPGIVHRLDRDTSGVLVVAKTDAVQRALSAAFAARAVRKEYLAAVHRLPADDEGVVDLPLGRSPHVRTRMAVRREGGRAAVTGWRVERRLPAHAVLRCLPVTGRTHQIRVHLQAIRHPIVGDPLYGDPGAPGDALPGRLMLHAHRIAFRHPATGAEVAFEAPPPPAFLAGIEALAALPPGVPARPRRGTGRGQYPGRSRREDGR